MEYIKKNCPECGKELSVPKDITSCICMFCGEMIQLQEEQAAIELPETDPSLIAAGYQKTLDKIIGFFEDKEAYLNDFNKSKYSESFEKYTRMISPILLPAEVFASLSPENRERVEVEMAKALVQAAEDDWKASNWGFLNMQKNKIFSSYSILLALYLIPAIRHLNYSISEALTDHIVEEWCRKYPRNPIHKGSYEEIMQGFLKRKICGISLPD